MKAIQTKSAAVLLFVVTALTAPPAGAMDFSNLTGAGDSLDPNQMISNFQAPPESCGQNNLFQDAAASPAPTCRSPDDQRLDPSQLLARGYRVQKQALATVTTTGPKGNPSVQLFSAVTDKNGNLAGLLVTNSLDGQTAYWDFRLQDMVKRPVVIVCHYNAIKIRVTMSQDGSAGTVRLYYNNVAPLGIYDYCDGQVRKTGSGDWALYSNGNEPVQSIDVVTSGHGIDTLRGFCS